MAESAQHRGRYRNLLPGVGLTRFFGPEHPGFSSSHASPHGRPLSQSCYMDAFQLSVGNR
jgi:hypothetical protein